MLAAPVDAIPEGPNLVYEPKWDGWRAIAFRGVGDVYLQSRAGRNLTPYFPDITRAVRAAVPPGVVLDGELVAWQRGRTSFAQLQRRVTAGRGLLRFAHEHPVYYVVFDLLVDAGAELVISLPLSERHARLVRLLTGARPQLAVTPQTQDLEEVSQWLTAWVVAGVEGIVIKRLDSRYEPGRRGWAKFRIRASTEAIIGGITGSLRNPATLLLGRFDRHGRLRYTGRTHPLTTPQRAELAMLLSPLVLPSPDAVVHPWPQPLPAGCRPVRRARAAALHPGAADRGRRHRSGHRVRAPAMASPRVVPAAQARPIRVRRAAPSEQQRRPSPDVRGFLTRRARRPAAGPSASGEPRICAAE